MGDLTFPRTARHGQRRVVGMWRDWNALREAVSLGDPVATQRAFDECEPWIDWCFGMAAERKDDALQQLADLGQQADRASETMAWGIVRKDGEIIAGGLRNREAASNFAHEGERVVRVAIRVVEGGDDAA